jgi:hypothetical protein
MVRTSSGAILCPADDPRPNFTGHAMFEFDPGTLSWKDLGPLLLASGLRRGAAFGDGILYTSDKGSVAFYDDVLGFCPEVQIATVAFTGNRVAAIDDTHAIVATSDTDRTEGLKWLSFTW